MTSTAEAPQVLGQSSAQVRDVAFILEAGEPKREEYTLVYSIRQERKRKALQERLRFLKGKDMNSVPSFPPLYNLPPALEGPQPGTGRGVDKTERTHSSHTPIPQAL